MSSSSAPVLSSLSLLLLPLLLHALPARAAPSTLPAAAPDISCYVESCAPLDVALLQEYVTSLNLSAGLNDVDARTGELPPFGALASDWSRLLLLQNCQPEGSALRDNLLRLSRIMLAAYFRAADRDDWKLPADERQSEKGSSPTPALQSESENQQANNVTLSSTAQKESTWINASSVDVVVAATAAYNNEEQSRSGNSSGSENDSTTTTTTSHYDSSVLPIEAAHFNQTSFTFAGDNKASGNKSNETFVDHNEDESSQLAAETSGQFFDTTPTTTLPNDEAERKKAPNEETTPGKESSAEPSSENSAANEALHERSKEDFRESQYKSKEIKNENGNLSGVAGDESAAGNRVKSDFGNFFALEDERANKSLSRNPTETSWESGDFSAMSSEELFRAFFGDDNSSDNNNKTLACTSAAERERDSFECNSTKSIEDENSSDKQNATKPPIGVELDIKSEEEPLTRSIEDFFKDDDASSSSDRGNGTEPDEASSASSIANFFNTETNEITANKLESREKLEGGPDETTRKFSEEAAAAGGAATSAELLLNETPLYPTEDPSVDERTKSRNIQKDEGTRDSAGELISAQGAELMLQDDRSSESNSTGGDNPATERTTTTTATTTTTTTTLAQLTSGRFSTAAYSNEITAAAAVTAATANGMEDRSAKYLDTSLPATTTTTPPTLAAGDQDKAVAEEHSVAAPSSSEPDGDRENRTGDRRDDLFRGTTPTVELQTATDDWSGSTAIPTSIEPATSEAPLVSQLRKRSLMTFHGGSKVLDDDEEKEGENEEDVWKLKESALNPPTAGSLRNQERDYRNGIAAGVMRNKRKSRKRADAELDGGKQYRTFLGLERRQT